MSNQKQTGTGQWLLEHPDFLEWAKGNKETVWCLGSRESCLHRSNLKAVLIKTDQMSAGVGKTVLA